MVKENEIFKDEDYFMSNENVQDMIGKLSKGGELEPIMVIQHPENEDVFLIMDGHHRKFSYEKANKLEIPARIVEYENILLANENGEIVSSLDKVRNDIEFLRNYFVTPDGTAEYSKED
jgi:ParB-like chromosome segregation protein Spo0J